jgi:hypothetical protein
MRVSPVGRFAARHPSFARWNFLESFAPSVNGRIANTQQIGYISPRAALGPEPFGYFAAANEFGLYWLRRRAQFAAIGFAGVCSAFQRFI